MARSSEALDPVGYLRAMSAASAVLGAHAVALDGLDSSPTPGGVSTAEVLAAGAGDRAAPSARSRRPGAGSDLAATLAAAVDAAGVAASFAAAGSAMHEAASRAASGRAGRRLAEFMGGMADVLANSDRVDATRFALCLEAGAERLAPTDDGTHPGGFVAVASAAADASLDAADRGSTLGDTVLAAANAGIEELEKGPVLDAGLAERGTVDAAAAGFLLVLDSVASVLTGEPLPEPPGADPSDAAGTPASPQRRSGRTEAFRITCRVSPHDPVPDALAELRGALHDLCDVAVVEPDGGHWSVEVVTTVPGAVVEMLASSGAMSETRIGLGDASGSPRVAEPAAARTG